MSLYRMDCEQERRRGLKRIEDHTPAELNAAIETAQRRFGDDFWIMLHGIDSYMERRRRRAASWKARQHQRLDELIFSDDVWGK